MPLPSSIKHCGMNSRCIFPGCEKRVKQVNRSRHRRQSGYGGDARDWLLGGCLEATWSWTDQLHPRKTVCSPLPRDLAGDIPFLPLQSHRLSSPGSAKLEVVTRLRRQLPPLTLSWETFAQNQHGVISSRLTHSQDFLFLSLLNFLCQFWNLPLKTDCTLVDLF